MAEIEAVKDGAITRILINRVDQMNSITPDMHRSLQGVFDDFATDDSQYIAVITGAGDRAFCAGSDLKSGIGKNYPEGGYAGLINRFDLPKPVIAAVNGFALGGGFEVALACDIIIASEKASFGLPETKVGAVALGGGLHRLPRQIGLKNAMGLILSSRRISAQEGYRLGFVNEVVAAADLDAAVQKWCDDILAGAPLSIQASKMTVQRGLDEETLDAALNAQEDYPEFARWRASKDAREGISAFTEKRKPNWQGR